MSLFVSLFRLFLEASPSPLTREQTSEKKSAILECLQGTSSSSGDGSSSYRSNDQQHLADDGHIDLWELRELALSPGGLLDVSIRKRAWPILTSCQMVILDSSAAAPRRSVSLSQSDLRSLKHDVKETVWDLKEYLQRKPSITRSWQGQEQSQNAAGSLVSKATTTRDHRRVSFAVDQGRRSTWSATINESDEADTIPPIGLSLTDTSLEDGAKEVNAGPTNSTAITCHDISAVSDRGTSPSMSHETSSNSSSSGRRVRWGKASKYEQNIVANVITNVLRTPAPEHASYTDDRFHYYSGLHNLTALLFANMESASLTSLVLGKLAMFHLRDAMRQDTSVAENALQMTLFPLLQQVDPALYNHICVRCGLKESGFALSWVTGWFASDVGYVAVGSRLIDVFLVSHPLMPVYCVVALLVSQRRSFLASKPSLKSVYSNLRSLKLMASLTMSNDEETYTQAMKQTEEIIASALKFIKQVPPQALIQLSYSRKEACSRAGIVMLSEAASPSWCIKDSCPTEWGALQRAKAIRTGHTRSLNETQPSIQHNSFQAYSNAYAAAGCKASKTTIDRSGHFVRRVLASLGFAAASALLYLTSSSARDLPKSRSGRLTTPSLQQDDWILPKISLNEKELPPFRTNSTNSSFNGPTLVETKGTNGMVVVIPPRYEFLASSAMNPAYELTDCERDFERFFFKPLYATIDKHANALLASFFNRPKEKLMIIVPAKPKDYNESETYDTMFPSWVCPVAIDPTQSIPMDTVLAEDSSLQDRYESVALVRYNQSITKKTKSNSSCTKATYDKVAIQARKIVKMGLQTVAFAARAARTTMARHVALLEESDFPPITIYLQVHL